MTDPSIERLILTVSWLVQLLRVESVAQVVILLGIVAGVGLAVGSLKVRGVGLGIAGVLFSGLVAGHILGKAHIQLDEHVLEFAREFGLILFVYTIGIQVGPGFFASLRRQGLPLNLMAAGIVIVGAGITILIHFVGKVEVPAAVGLFSGASTNTPSLAAAQQALKDAPNLPPDAIKMPALAYAVAYPVGIVGIILTMLLVRGVFRISPAKELEMLVALRDAEHAPMKTMNIELRNPNLVGLKLSRVPTLADSGVVISRVMQGGRATVARGDTVLSRGNVLLAVGLASKLDELKLIVGAEAAIDVKSVPGDVLPRRIVVTRISRLGHFGRLVWHMPLSANVMTRELGIVLFLSCVGLRSGDKFLATLLQGDGLRWMLFGSLITFLPLIVVALVARIFLKLNYLNLCGLLAGSMTDPPALAFAQSVTNSDAPSVSYATVYPLVMLLRVLIAQIMVLTLVG